MITVIKKLIIDRTFLNCTAELSTLVHAIRQAMGWDGHVSTHLV